MVKFFKVIFSLLSNVSEISIGTKAKNVLVTTISCKIHCTYHFSDICEALFIRSVSFALFGVILLFKFISFVAKSVLFAKSSI